MLQSKLFTKTRKTAPTDEVSKNAKLLTQGGFIHKEMAGVYSYLPLGLRVLNKIENIIREEMDAIGGQEIRMATLHPSEPWKQTGAWDSVDVLFKIKSRTEKDYALGQSEEEIITPIAGEFVQSYKDLPVAIYQIGQKYRDELRAKSGIIRGREFGMKDMYSFHESQKDFEQFYEVVKKAYFRAYKRCGLTAKVTEASGGAFSQKISYEFMVLTDAGEDTIFYCDSCDYCINAGIAKVKEGDKCSNCGKSKLKKAVASEVGNVFDLGDKYPRAFEFTYKGDDGSLKYPIVGCYGFGTTRLLGVIAEALSDERGIIWPKEVAPFMVHLIDLSKEGEPAGAEARKIYENLQKEGITVLYDERKGISAGEKFADADLIGIPYRAVISEKSVAAGGVEIKERGKKETRVVDEKALIKFLKK
ncbi:MAG: hypothetical protein A2648_02210 [Candidatus Lloydbacteria bacterium RIFCSPHIGHO2_01_FULL_41_20]|uniref:Proline--tRNA ligase n=1 Tax=Candidatus Lloydbacteria bacterium RIFCSPHIGHO2_01_FULL_41_20 TaxID=1798657 RepID=A0A1G2CQT1_9BACT|nr:MAG: hypothetical protein A2648_02210 [Candidatus Lloydbacteria bacterium RIFCSPHIGHO2_01_FULL_41_20]